MVAGEGRGSRAGTYRIGLNWGQLASWSFLDVYSSMAEAKHSLVFQPPLILTVWETLRDDEYSSWTRVKETVTEWVRHRESG